MTDWNLTKVKLFSKRDKSFVGFLFFSGSTFFILSLHPLHHIHIPQPCMPSADTCCRQHLCQLNGTTATQRSGKLLFQLLMDNSGSKRQAIRLAPNGGCIRAAYNIFYRVYSIICQIVTLQSLFFLFAEPMSDAGKQFRFQLCIDLRMVHTGAIDVMFHFDADKSAATCRVVKQVGAVARADKRSYAGECTEVFLISFTDVEAGHLHQILQ